MSNSNVTTILNNNTTSNASSPSQIIVPDTTFQLAFGITCVILSVFMIVTSVMFWRKRTTESIKKRMVPLVLFTAVCSAITMNMSLAGMDDMLHPIFQFCIARLTVQTLFAPCWLFGNFLRTMNLQYMHLVSQIRYELSIDPHSDYLKTLSFWKIWLLKAFSRKRIAGQELTNNPSSGDMMKSMTSKLITSAFSNEKQQKTHKMQGSVMSQHASLTTGNSNGAVKVLDLSGEIPMRSLVIWISGFVALAVIGMGIEIALGASGVIPNLDKTNFSALYVTICNPNLNLARYILQVGVLVLTILILVSIRNIEDTMNFKNEIFASSLVNISLEVWYLVITFGTKSGSSARFTLGGGFIQVLANILQHSVTVVWPLIQAYRNERLYKGANLESGFGTVDAMIIVLNNPRTFLDFKKELLMQFCIENGIFYDEYMKLERKVRNKKDSSKIFIAKELKRINNVFIASDSPQELNIPQKLKKTFQDLIQGEDSVGFEALLPIKDEVVKMMFLNTYPRYLKTYGNANSKMTKGSSLDITRVKGSTSASVGNLASKSASVGNLASTQE